jgi:HK97 family phage portal protein
MARFWPFNKKKALTDTRLPMQIMWTGNGFSMVPYAVNSYIKEGYTMNSAVYSIVTALADKFSTVPFYVYKVKSRSKTQKYIDATKSGFNPSALAFKSAAMDEVAENDPLAMLLAKPNSYQTDADFRKMWLTFLKLTGLTSVYSNTGLTGSKPLSLHVLPTQWVTLVADGTLMDAAKVSFSPFGGGVNELDRAKVYLAKYVNPDVQTDGSHLYGLSPLKAALLDMQGSSDATKAMAKMYQNGGAKGAFTPKENLGPEQISAFRKVVQDWINGYENKGTAGAFSAPVDWLDIGHTSVDMQLLEGKRLTEERIATVYKYPPALLKGDNKFDNDINAVKYLITNSLYPDLVMFRDMYNTWITQMYPGAGYFVDFDISILPEMQADMEKVTEQALKLVGAGIINRNEARQLVKYDEVALPEMQMFTVQGSVMPLADAMMQDVEITQDYADTEENGTAGKN